MGTHKFCSSKIKLKLNQDKESINLNSGESFTQQNFPIKKLSLRGNQLCGSVLIGNYSSLTQLEICDNEMERLDLSSLGQLESLKCSWNKLTVLILNGSNLCTLIANNNRLNSIVAKPSPSNLTYIDISHNKFTELPKWIPVTCTQLQNLHVQNNFLENINELLLCNNINRLKVLHLGYNNIRGLSLFPNNFCSLEKLFLQDNGIQSLPENFFNVTHKKLKILNLSCNKLQTLPRYELSTPWHLENLYLTSNSLNAEVFNILQWAIHLRVLHIAYNKISQLSEICLQNWKNIEELVLSGNILQQIPDQIVALKQLKILRIHSNLLLSIPKLYQMKNLQVIDLAHNHLEHINLLYILPKDLKYLDLSYNLKLQVDEQQVKVCQTQRNWSLIDVTGKNRNSLPTHKMTKANENVFNAPWLVGFSETPGYSSKLLVCQMRMCNYRNNEGLFGMFESKVSRKIANSFAKIVPTLLHQSHIPKDKLNEYMKNTLIAAEQKTNVNSNVSAILCHLSKENVCNKLNSITASKSKQYVLRISYTGSIGAFLIRKTSIVALTQKRMKVHLLEDVLQDPVSFEFALGNDDEYIVICNEHLWSVMDVNCVAREIRKEDNVVLAAKRVQEIAQSFGATDNLSIIVIKLRNLGTDVDHLIQEFKRSTLKKMEVKPDPTTYNGKHCDFNNFAAHNSQPKTPTPIYFRGDRCSPSGQSDSQINTSNKNHVSDCDDLVVAHARVVEVENEMEMLAETDSVLSEEQFKCWEYILEQNTQLLFDKELSSISKSFSKTRNIAQQSDLNQDQKPNLINTVCSKFLSQSSPQLSSISKRSASKRTVQECCVSDIANSKKSAYLMPLGSKKRTKFVGGPNAAYFGSLQRLTPYDYENDFFSTQDFQIDYDDDIHEEIIDSRIKQYWGVATTEL